MRELECLKLLMSVAHDLRSPLTVISGTAMALRESAPGSSRAGLDKILRETQRLGRMLENRVVAALLLSGSPLRREWVTVEDLVGVALARTDASLDRRSVCVRIGDDVIANLDSSLGELVIGNLLDNAAQHTPPETWVELAARRGASDVVIEVADAGAGMVSGSHLDTAQLERGKGLAVCAAIASAYGGSLEILSRDGGGTVVRFRIPDGEAPSADSEPC